MDCSALTLQEFQGRKGGLLCLNTSILQEFQGRESGLLCLNTSILQEFRGGRVDCSASTLQYFKSFRGGRWIALPQHFNTSRVSGEGVDNAAFQGGITVLWFTVFLWLDWGAVEDVWSMKNEQFPLIIEEVSSTSVNFQEVVTLSQLYSQVIAKDFTPWMK